MAPQEHKHLKIAIFRSVLVHAYFEIYIIYVLKLSKFHLKLQKIIFSPSTLHFSDEINYLDLIGKAHTSFHARTG